MTDKKKRKRQRRYRYSSAGIAADNRYKGERREKIRRARKEFDEDIGKI